jgi:hypothetical protein
MWTIFSGGKLHLVGVKMLARPFAQAGMNAPRLGKFRKDGLLVAALQREWRNSVPPLTKAQ